MSPIFLITIKYKGKIMKLQEMIFMVEEDPEGGYNAKALGESIFTQGETLDELKLNIKEALTCHFDNENEIPGLIRLHIVKEELVEYA